MFTQVSKRQLHRTLLSFLLIIALISAMIMSSVIPSHAAGGAALLAAFTESAVAVVAAHPVAACILVTLAIGAGVGAASNSYALEGLAQDLLSKIPADILSVLDGLSDIVLSGSFSISSLISAGATDLVSWFLSWVSSLSPVDDSSIAFDTSSSVLISGTDYNADYPVDSTLWAPFFDFEGYYYAPIVFRNSNHVAYTGYCTKSDVEPTYSNSVIFGSRYNLEQWSGFLGGPYSISYKLFPGKSVLFTYTIGSHSVDYEFSWSVSNELGWPVDVFYRFTGQGLDIGSGSVFVDSTFFPSSGSGQALTQDQPLTIPQDVQSAVGATAPDVRGSSEAGGGDVVVDPPISGDTSGTITGEGGGTGVFEGVGNWILNIPILGDILAALQSIISQLQQLLSADLPEELQYQIEVFRDALVDKLALNQFTQSFAAFQQMQTGYGTAPKITLNLHALANTAQQVGSFSNTFPDEESVVIDFSFLEDERFKFMDLTLIDLIRALGSLAMVMSTALYCYKKITSGDVIG